MPKLDYNLDNIVYVPLHYNHLFAHSYGFKYSYQILIIFKPNYLICRWNYDKYYHFESG